ncbi:hypothetical protein DBR06_SOUSAS4410069, partial [Sousa chinensis]
MLAKSWSVRKAQRDLCCLVMIIKKTRDLRKYICTKCHVDVDEQFCVIKND